MPLLNGSTQRASLVSRRVFGLNRNCCLKIGIVPRGWRGIVFSLALLSALCVKGASPVIQFNRDIRPILSENCFACHGPDNNARKAGLRLDTKEGIFEHTPKHEPAVVPRNPEKS